MKLTAQYDQDSRTITLYFPSEFDASTLADGAVTTVKLADDAVTQAKIADNSVITAHLQDSLVTAAKIANLAVSDTKLADLAVTSGKVAQEAITTTSDRDGICQGQTVGGAGNLTINGAYASGGVATLSPAAKVSIYSAGDLDALTFTVYGTNAADQSQNEAITGPNNTTVYSTNNFKTVTQVAVNGAVGTNVEVGAIYTAIDFAAIETAHIKDAAIGAAAIATAAVGTANIADAAITSAKIATAAVGTANIADANITGAKVANLTLTSGLINDEQVTVMRAAVGGGLYFNGTNSDIGYLDPGASYTLVTTPSLTVTNDASIIVLAMCTFYNNQASSRFFSMSVGGVASASIRIASGAWATLSLLSIDSPGNGAKTYTLYAHTDTSAASTNYCQDAGLVILEGIK